MSMCELDRNVMYVLKFIISGEEGMMGKKEVMAFFKTLI
jgi:hypothetical protein